jgi:hypothetical protein
VIKVFRGCGDPWGGISVLAVQLVLPGANPGLVLAELQIVKALVALFDMWSSLTTAVPTRHSASDRLVSWHLSLACLEGPVMCGELHLALPDGLFCSTTSQCLCKARYFPDSEAHQ